MIQSFNKHFALILLITLLLHGCAMSQSRQDTVCITKTGAKYHRCTCHYLKYSQFEIDLDEASARGYTACSVCKPPTLEDNNMAEEENTGSSRIPETRVVSPQIKSHTQNNGKTTSSQQCTALTKSGSRCKRTASNGSSRCWQHQ